MSALGVEEQRVWVIAEVTTPRGEWTKLGDAYRVESRFILWSGDDVRQVPASAVFRSGDGFAVFVVEDDDADGGTGGDGDPSTGVARLRSVTVGQRSGLRVEIVDGLEDGERVVLHPPGELEDDARGGGPLRRASTNHRRFHGAAQPQAPSRIAAESPVIALGRVVPYAVGFLDGRRTLRQAVSAWTPATTILKRSGSFVRRSSSTRVRETRFLTDACWGDADLRSRVDLLLETGLEEEAVLPLRGGFGRSMRSGAELEDVPERIGRYSILDVLGEGGMGVVYLAEQTEPVRRRVALKLIKAGMDTKEVIARFEAERQALALMNHPNIAQIHDAGETDSGRAYFIMEAIRGFAPERVLRPRTPDHRRAPSTLPAARLRGRARPRTWSPAPRPDSGQRARHRFETRTDRQDHRLRNREGDARTAHGKDASNGGRSRHGNTGLHESGAGGPSRRGH